MLDLALFLGLAARALRASPLPCRCTAACRRVTGEWGGVEEKPGLPGGGSSQLDIQGSGDETSMRVMITASGHK